MYDRNAMDNVNLWLEESRKKNEAKAKNNEIECESLDKDWETPDENHMCARKVNRVASEETTVMQKIDRNVNTSTNMNTSLDDNFTTGTNNGVDNRVDNDVDNKTDEKQKPQLFSGYWLLIGSIVYLVCKYFHVFGH
jgi:ATP-dependent Lon protease